MQRFDPEKLDAYRTAAEFVALPHDVVENRRGEEPIWRINNAAAILDVCRRLELVSEASYAVGRDLLLRIVSMLVAMVRRDSGSGTGTGTGRGTEEETDRDTQIKNVKRVMPARRPRGAGLRAFESF